MPAPPLGLSRDFEDHVLTSACPASAFRCCGATPKRDQRANTVATKKTDKNADQRAYYYCVTNFHASVARLQLRRSTGSVISDQR